MIVPSAVPLCLTQVFYSGACVGRPSRSNTSGHPGLCDQQNAKGHENDHRGTAMPRARSQKKKVVWDDDVPKMLSMRE